MTLNKYLQGMDRQFPAFFLQFQTFVNDNSIYLHEIKNMRNIILIVNVIVLVVVIGTPG